MAAPVWVLSVDLQTKTATFQTGLADAAKAARGSFTDIKSGANEMGRDVGYSTMEARHSVMLLGEEFGVHLPRAIASFIASIGPLGGALEAAFPFLAIAVGATLVLEHLAKMREAGEKLTEDQTKFGTTVNTVWNQLDQKILQAQIRADDLRNNHLAALTHQLELIDKESLGELVHAFEEVAKAGDVVMKELEGHWYSFGKGSDGAKHALDEFQTQYASLLAQGKGEAASGLLHGTLAQAERVQQLLNARTVKPTGDNQVDTDAYNKAVAAHQELDKLGISTGANLETQVAAQNNLVAALQAQVGSEERIAALKKLEKGNATQQEGNDEAGKRASAARQAAESMLRVNEESLAADKATAEAALTTQRASLEERLKSDLDFAGKDHELKDAANKAEIAALDKNGKDYANQLKALNEKSVEIGAEYAAKEAELKAHGRVEMYDRDLRNLEQAEHEKLDATKEGTSARLAAIDASIKEEQAKGLQDTSFFRELLNMRVSEVRQEAEEESKLRDEAIKQGIDAQNKAAQEQTRHSSAMNKIENPKSTDDTAAKQAELDKEYAANHAELMKELTDTQSMGQARVAEERKINDELAALDKKYQDQKAELAAQEAQTEKAAAMEVANAFGQSLLRVAEGHQSMARMAQQAFTSIVTHSLEAALMEVAHEKTAQLAHAESAAAAAMHAMSGIPVIGPALGIVAGAATFAAAMAFESGTDRVPGIGRGDIVPAMLTPGEGVVPNGVMDGLRGMVLHGGFAQQSSPAVHVHATYHVQSLDGDGLQAVLDKHTDQLQRHFEQAVRKMNR